MKPRLEPTSAPSIFRIADDPLLLRLHRWSGLALALVVLCVGCTGALTTYQHEIDTWLNPDLLRVAPVAGPAQSLDQVVAAAAQSRPDPDLGVTGVRLAQDPVGTVEVSLSPRSGDVFDGWYVYVNPRDAHVLGSRPFAPDTWSRRGLVASLYEVHYSLAASRTGVWIVTIAAGCWIATSVVGVWLAWPRSKRGWRRAFRVDFAGGAARINRDLHRSTGLLSVVFVVVVLATGILLNLSPQTATVVQRFSDLTAEPRLPARVPVETRGAVGWQTALDSARRAQPASTPFAIFRDETRGLYVVRLRESDAIHRRGQVRVYVDARDAGVLAVWNPRSGSAGDRFMAWLNPLHSGFALGGWGRTLVFLSGLAAVVFVLTGVPLWFARRRARHRR